jgi:hypothetical protein
LGFHLSGLLYLHFISLEDPGNNPLDYNHFKIPLTENLMKRAIRDA